MEDEKKIQDNDNHQVRIIQWGTWRTLSSTFLRCMMNAEKSVTFCEPFGLPWYFGKEGEAKTSRTLIPIELPQDCRTFECVKKKYEASYDDKKVVFGKEFAFYVSPRENYKYIPRGYRHSFLIRHPYKSVTSLCKVMERQDDPGYHHFLSEEVRFEDIWHLYNYVTNHIDPHAIVIDADDLVRNPEAVLRHYCSNYNIEYNNHMLNWDANSLNQEMLLYGESWFGDLLTSQTVRRDTNVKNLLEQPPDITHLSQELRNCIEENLIFYKKLYQVKVNFD